MKKLLTLLLCCTLLLSGCGPQPEPDNGKLKVVAAVFPAYDFARAAGGTLADVELLLPPGAESHSYEPTPADILAVQNCDLFIYLGGESDAWVDTILSSIDMRGQVLRMVDCVELLEEETVEGMQEAPGHDHDHHDHEEDEDHHHEEDDHGLGAVVGMDEHVWTSPKNAAAITRTIGAALGEADPANSAAYAAAAENYARQIELLDREFAAFFDSRSAVDSLPSKSSTSSRDMFFASLSISASASMLIYAAPFPAAPSAFALWPHTLQLSHRSGQSYPSYGH